jgi:1-acyl-sn-glycerol-3-phosphate acyltransferase
MGLGQSIRRTGRSIIRLGVLLGTAGEYCVRFFARRTRGAISLSERAHWLHKSCRTGLSRLGITVDVTGSFPVRGLVISNHMSYLDILVYSSISPCVFVSKKEVKSWPIFGQMARMAGTVFIDRSRSADTRRVNAEMQEALSGGAVVVLFPEGTSSDGTSVLPFRPALFDAAVRANESITPAHLGYDVPDGSPGNDVGYWGSMSFFPHLLRLLSKRGIRAQIHFSSEPRKFEDRKMAAQETHEMVLALSRLSPAQSASAQRSSARPAEILPDAD